MHKFLNQSEALRSRANSTQARSRGEINRSDQVSRSAWVVCSLAALIGFVVLLADTGEKPDANGVPVGSIIAFGGPLDQAAAPQGWLLCDGRQLSSAEYEQLFRAIGYAWGQGERDGTFRIPDLRGLFLRGVSGSADEQRDPDRQARVPAANGGNSGNQVGSIQYDELKRHGHMFSGLPLAAGAGNIGTEQYLRFYATRPSDSEPELMKSVHEEGGIESRPKNAYVHWIIKAK